MAEKSQQPLLDQSPIWARPEAFPASPGGWGWCSVQKIRHPVESEEALREVILTDRSGEVDLVWIPGRQWMAIPEEVPQLADSMLATRRRWVLEDRATTSARMRVGSAVTAGLAAYIVLQIWHAPELEVFGPLPRAIVALRLALNVLWTPVIGLVYLIFVFIPWYRARKRVREMQLWSSDRLERIAPLMRFETWLARQEAPVTRVLVGIIALVGLAQFLPGDGIAAAGLVRAKISSGEWWRLATSPLIHGNPVHFALNAAAFLYLGKRVEVFARWPHLVLVFILGAWMGGEASLRITPLTSLGASGGLMALLGFLLAFETLHANLVPRPARRRLLGGLLMTVVIGLLGYRFIDNAAHFGGVVAGFLYALIVFPPSSSALRPRSTRTDLAVGAIGLAAIVAAAILAIWKITGA